MGLSTANAAATWRTDGHRRKILATAAVADTCQLRNNLIQAGVDIVCKLDFSHRAQAVEANSDRSSDNATFSDGGINDPRFTVLFLQPFSAPEYTAKITDVFAHDDH